MAPRDCDPPSVDRTSPVPEKGGPVPAEWQELANRLADDVVAACEALPPIYVTVAPSAEPRLNCEKEIFCDWPGCSDRCANPYEASE